MSNLIDPNTNKPISRKLSDQEIIQALQVIQIKVDALAQQQFHTGILIEWVMETIQNTLLNKNAFDNSTEAQPLITFDITKFNEFATARTEELKKEYLEQIKDIKEIK